MTREGPSALASFIPTASGAMRLWGAKWEGLTSRGACIGASGVELKLGIVTSTSSA